MTNLSPFLKVNSYLFKIIISPIHKKANLLAAVLKDYLSQVLVPQDSPADQCLPATHITAMFIIKNNNSISLKDLTPPFLGL